ncbi:MAG: phosphate ABC transporter permease subunit PstC [Pedosphaera sp. Tous-C6FEB]|nr:MAG: phosphate ABC transporter permease subunit PstC [Pedosphaera sp. Tous-C6FEB]
MGLKRGHRARPFEWVVEKGIFAVSLSAIAVIFLIFVFIGREAVPIFLGQEDSAALREVIPVADLDKVPREQLRAYLGLDADKFAELEKEKDKETLKTLMEIREEAFKELPAAVRTDPDAKVNTTEWRYLLGAHQWSGYDKPEYIWQPIGNIHKYNIMPLIIGSLKTTLVGLAFAVPLALGAAIYVSQLARPRVKEWLKPAIELLSGIPSVVIGTFALLALATFLQSVFGYEVRLNAFVAGIALSFAVIPLIFSIAEDALTSVPRSYTQAALALGASPWQNAWQIVLPAALPGVFAAVVLGFGRAIGETMVVLMVTSASVMSWSVFDGTRSITATIAAEMAEAVAGGHHYRILFMLGAILFAVTFVTNMIGDIIIHRLKGQLEGRK